MDGIEFLKRLGMHEATVGHLIIVNDFIKSGDRNAVNLLNRLCSWTEEDLLMTNWFIKENLKSK